MSEGFYYQISLTYLLLNLEPNEQLKECDESEWRCFSFLHVMSFLQMCFYNSKNDSKFLFKTQKFKFENVNSKIVMAYLME